MFLVSWGRRAWNANQLYFIWMFFGVCTYECGCVLLKSIRKALRGTQNICSGRHNFWVTKHETFSHHCYNGILSGRHGDEKRRSCLATVVIMTFSCWIVSNLLIKALMHFAWTKKWKQKWWIENEWSSPDNLPSKNA